MYGTGVVETSIRNTKKHTEQAGLLVATVLRRHRRQTHMTRRRCRWSGRTGLRMYLQKIGTEVTDGDDGESSVEEGDRLKTAATCSQVFECCWGSPNEVLSTEVATR